MQITITSGSVQAICAVLTVLFAACAFAIDAMIARRIRNLNGFYTRSAGSTMTGAEIERMLLRHVEEIDELRPHPYPAD